MFQCKSCDKQFTQEQQLQGHVSEHGGSLAITTQVCTLLFNHIVFNVIYNHYEYIYISQI